MKSAWRRGGEVVLGLVVLCAVVVWLSGGCEEKVEPGVVEMPGERVPADRIVPVESVSERALEWATGEVSSARHTTIASRVLARIEDVRVRAGSAVKAGDVLVVLDSRDLQARVREAQELLKASEARLRLAEQEYTRTEELFRTGIAPKQRIDEASATLRAARSDAAGRREALDEARAAASFAEIRSTVAGRVVDRLAEPGDTAVPGQPLLRIYDPALLRVEVPVRESLAVHLKVGDTLTVEIPALERSPDGRIDEIVPFAEPGARTLLVKVSLPRTDAQIFAGMFARVAIPTEERTRLLVPADAIERVGQLEFVTVVGDGDRGERRLVTSGGSSPRGGVEILSGLAAGERVRVPANVPAPTTESS